MVDPYELAMSRSRGFFSEQEIATIGEKLVAVAGTGGDGGRLAESLVRAGVTRFSLADPEEFETENFNRQAFSNTETVGTNKAEVVASEIKKINPEAEVRVFSEGVTADNVGEFIADADLIIDETEFTLHGIGVMLARNARDLNIPNLQVMNIGFGATVTTFSPDGKFKFEDMLGLDPEAPLEEIAEQEVGLDKWLPNLPPYIDIEVLQKVMEGQISAPSVGAGVNMAASLGEVQAILNFVGGQNNRPLPVYAPEVLVIDSYQGVSKRVPMGGQGFEDSMKELVLRNEESKVPKVT